jgi:hypothetical protein
MQEMSLVTEHLLYLQEKFCSIYLVLSMALKRQLSQATAPFPPTSGVWKVKVMSPHVYAIEIYGEVEV